MAADKPRLRIYGEPELALPYIGAANNLLFRVRQVAENAGVPIYSLTEDLADGTTIKAAVSGRFSEISISPATSEQIATQEEKPDKEQMLLAIGTYERSIVEQNTLLYTVTIIDIHQRRVRFVGSERLNFDDYVGDSGFEVSSIFGMSPAGDAVYVFPSRSVLVPDGEWNMPSAGFFGTKSIAEYASIKTPRLVRVTSVGGFLLGPRYTLREMRLDESFFYTPIVLEEYGLVSEDQMQRLYISTAIGKFNRETHYEVDRVDCYQPAVRSTASNTSYYEGVRQISNTWYGMIAAFVVTFDTPTFGNDAGFEAYKGALQLIDTETMTVLDEVSINEVSGSGLINTPPAIHLGPKGVLLVLGNFQSGYRAIRTPLNALRDKMEAPSQGVEMPAPSLPFSTGDYQHTDSESCSVIDDKIVFSYTICQSQHYELTITAVVYDAKSGEISDSFSIAPDLPSDVFPYGDYEDRARSSSAIVTRQEAMYLMDSFALRNPPE